MSSTTDTPRTLRELADRYDPDQFEVGRSRARIRLSGAGPKAYDVLLDGDGRAKLVSANGAQPDAVLDADEQTWETIASDLRGGMDAYRRGRLKIRRDLHLGVGFLAATASSEMGGLRIRNIRTAHGPISISEAGQGPAVLMVHGLGATKVSFLPTLAALAPQGFRAIAVDLPGFGDSHKPILARYDAAFFAEEMCLLLDALDIDRAHVIGNSMGGRVAIEIGLSCPERVQRLALLAPSLAWLRDRPWAPYLRMVAPQLGLFQPAPRFVVEQIVRNASPGRGRGMDLGRDRRVPALLSDAPRPGRVLCRRAQHLSRGAAWSKRLLDAAAGAPATEPVRVGSQGSAGADWL